MMRSTFLPLISPLPSPVALALAASHATRVSKNIGIASSDGSVAAGSPASTAAITNMNFIATLRLWPDAVTRTCLWAEADVRLHGPIFAQDGKGTVTLPGAQGATDGEGGLAVKLRKGKGD